jgi:phosphoglycerate dehydrogenase-like enzyme
MIDTGNDIWNDLIGILGKGDIGSDVNDALTAWRASVVYPRCNMRRY